MPYDEDTKVFDVARPSKAYPDATSRPIIVGHRPQMNDPMVRDEAAPATSSTPIHVSMPDEEPPNDLIRPAEVETPSGESEVSGGLASNYGVPEQEEQKQPDYEESNSNALSQPEHTEEHSGENVEEASSFTSLHSLIPEESKDPKNPKNIGEDDEHPSSHDDGWHEAPPLPITRGAGPRRRWPKILGILFLLALFVVVIGYLAIDDGLVQSNIKLPFHIFNKQKTGAVVTSPPAPTPVTNTAPAANSVVPAGFTAYKITDKNISFAYPTAWGTPTTTTDPGFSKRGGTNKSDSTYAYLVDFATNKDVQLAFTSSKYLPAARGALYYDFLQWCSGTNDGKFYKQTLHFVTTSGVDTPSTITCDQGPLADAIKIDNISIVQPNTKDASGKSLGDLYTEDLTGADVTVLRVKDSTMKNADDIKKLLNTVKSGTPATP